MTTKFFFAFSYIWTDYTCSLDPSLILAPVRTATKAGLTILVHWVSPVANSPCQMFFYVNLWQERVLVIYIAFSLTKTYQTTKFRVWHLYIPTDNLKPVAFTPGQILHNNKSRVITQQAKVMVLVFAVEVILQESS